jgi:hypothetical protein
MGEVGLGISRNMCLTTKENLWKFYRGISIEELNEIYNGTWSTVDKFFTTNILRAKGYSFNETIYVEIHYQMGCNWKEQMSIFNMLSKNQWGNFYDIICDRDLFYILHIKFDKFFINNRCALKDELFINKEKIEAKNNILEILKQNKQT